ncbi:MAG: phosphate transport system regulatory protein PhoU [Bdellovibrionales bacterium RIFCSPHIGHO2_01_FULL_40_29]|nr:MAG: phosphate transport system regulatory protein PhoU [Bdellovibrionales bacterium RIFCSPHIGHO2_01_FULL_40_29]OFZ33355.1 MAG: phosphate transport system regulatory protein PhoU [Bdellovibrionales bacterium RIFCSPHIGHO2_02_FULL_40_15]
MERTIDSQLEDLKNLTVEMGGQVEKALQTVLNGVSRRDLQQFASVHTIEQSINDLQIKIDNACLEVLAKQGPVARDLRFILSIIKINTDLERMGDQCVNIAYIGKDVLNRSNNISFQDIEVMASTVKTMVKAALDSFVKMSSTMAKDVLVMDDEIDRLKNKVVSDAISRMKIQPEQVENLLDLILIARNLERLGDHSTNIAEDVIFALTGKDIRHQA